MYLITMTYQYVLRSSSTILLFTKRANFSEVEKSQSHTCDIILGKHVSSLYASYKNNILIISNEVVAHAVSGRKSSLRWPLVIHTLINFFLISRLCER